MEAKEMQRMLGFNSKIKSTLSDVREAQLYISTAQNSIRDAYMNPHVEYMQESNFVLDALGKINEAAAIIDTLSAMLESLDQKNKWMEKMYKPDTFKENERL